MSELSATIDIGGAIDFLKQTREQVLLAEVRAVNATAIDVQKFTVGTLLPNKFTLRARGNPWQKQGTKYGFNVKFASMKSDVAESTVGSRADWLKLQEEGGTKSKSGHRLAIVVDARESKTSVIRSKDKPSRLLGSAKDGSKSRLKQSGFKIQSSNGEGIFVRESGGNLRLMYWLKPDAKIKPTLAFVSNGRKIVLEKFEPNFNAAFLKVLPKAIQ